MTNSADREHGTEGEGEVGCDEEREREEEEQIRKQQKEEREGKEEENVSTRKRKGGGLAAMDWARSRAARSWGKVKEICLDVIGLGEEYFLGLLRSDSRKRGAKFPITDARMMVLLLLWGREHWGKSVADLEPLTRDALRHNLRTWAASLEQLSERDWQVRNVFIREEPLWQPEEAFLAVQSFSQRTLV